eukprot:gene3341-4189_t
MSVTIFRVYIDDLNNSIEVPLIENGITKDEIGDIKLFVGRKFNITDNSSFNLVLQNNESCALPTIQSLSSFTDVKLTCDNVEDILKWIVNDYIEGIYKEPPPLTDLHLPFLERDDILNNIVNNAIDRYQNRDSNSRQKNPFVVISGAPGIGKTRILYSINERLSKIKSLPSQQLSLEISFKNGTMFNPNTYDKDITEDSLVALRILYRYFVEGSKKGYEAFFREFCNKFNCDTLTPLISFQCILLYNISNHQLDPNKELMVNFGIDEFQETLIENNETDLLKYQKLKRATLSKVIRSISNLLISPPKPFFFNITFAGTVLEDIGIIISKDFGNKYFDFQPQFLSYESYIEIGKYVLQRELPKNVIRALIFSGGWPRPLEIILNSILFCSKKQPIENYKVSELLSIAKNNFQESYPSNIGVQFHPLIISYVISGIPVNLFDTIISDEQSVTFSDLQRRGQVSINNKGEVLLPLYFIYNYIDSLPNPPTMYKYLKLALNIAEELNFDDPQFELFSYYEIARIQSFKNIYEPNSKVKTLTLENYFGKDALFIPDEIRANSIDLVNFNESKHIVTSSRVPETIPFLSEGKNGKYIIINAKGGLMETIINFSDKYFFGSMKYTDQNETITQHEFELNKSVKAAYHLGIQSTDFYTINITNKRITRDMEVVFEANSKLVKAKIKKEIETEHKEKPIGNKRAKTEKESVTIEMKNLSSVLICNGRDNFFTSFAQILKHPVI